MEIGNRRIKTATAKGSIKSSISNRQSPLSNHSLPTFAFNSSNQLMTMMISPPPISRA